MAHRLISFFILILVVRIHCLPGIIKIGERIHRNLVCIQRSLLGGLFDISDQGSDETIAPEMVFRRCVDTINSLDILPNSTLSTQIERVPATDPFHTGKRGAVVSSFNVPLE